MFYIDYENDGKTACIKQARGMEYVGEAKNGAKIYAKPNAAGDHREWYYTVGGCRDMLAEFIYMSWATLDDLRETMNNLTKEQTAKAFPDRETRLIIINKRVENGAWTSNGEALFCELCGKYELAEKVRKNRTEYLARKHAAEQAKEREREQREAERKAQEEKAKAKELEQAEQDLKTGNIIEAEHFEALAVKYGIALSIKFIGWLRKWCDGVKINKASDGTYRVAYWANKKHKSTSIFEYANKLGAACGI